MISSKLLATRAMSHPLWHNLIFVYIAKRILPRGDLLRGKITGITPLSLKTRHSMPPLYDPNGTPPTREPIVEIVQDHYID